MQPNFAFLGHLQAILRCLNSKEIKLLSSIRVICIPLDLRSVQLRFQVQQQFQHVEYDMNQTLLTIFKKELNY